MSQESDSASLNKVIVITGASDGIGAALAKLAGRKGAKLVLVARREEKLRAVAQASSRDAVPVAADVTDRAAVKRVFAAAVERFGHVDVWVNNAGRGITRSVADLTDEDFDDIMRVNVKSALYGMQTVLPHFRERGRGHIINVSSMLGRVPFAPFRSVYSAAKHALNALTASLRIDMQASHPEVHVSTVSPGVVATSFGSNAKWGGADSRTIPNAQPVEEVAQVILDLIENPSADVYTRPGMRDMVTKYFAAEDMAAVEAGFSVAAPARKAGR